MLIFLDIDGVLVLNGRKFERKLVNHLNNLIATYFWKSGKNVEIVFNSAWNVNPIDDMKKWLAEAGFLYTNCIIGKTPGTSGGGELIRRWLTTNNRVGEPFILLDDSSHDIQAMWCRIAQSVTSKGFNRTVARKAETIMLRKITEDGERKAACENLLAQALRVQKASWLTADQKADLAAVDCALLQELLLKPHFLEHAFLKP